MEKQYFYYYVEEDTNLDYIAKVFFKDKTGSELLDFGANKEMIYSLYDDDEKKEFSSGSVSLVKRYTPIQIPIEGSSKYPNITVKRKDVLLYTELEKLYFPEDVQKFLTGSYEAEIYKDEGNDTEQLYVRKVSKVYILIYSRSLDRLIEMTDFYMQGTFGVEAKGGSFNFEFLPIEGKWNTTKQDWSPVSNDSYKVFRDPTSRKMASYYNKSNFYKKNGQRIDLYFEKIFNPQDIVFVKTDEDFFDKEHINPNRTKDKYQMIGLVDNILPSLRIDGNSVQVSLSISGKDLSKIFNTDQTHFFPIEFVKGEKDLIGNYNQIKDKKLVDRIFGKLNDLDFGQGQTIEKLFDLIVDKLTSVTVGIESSNCFTVEKGIWDFISLKIDPETATRELFDSSISTMSGPVMNFFQKLVRGPFAEMVMDTYGSKYQMFIRTPPLTKDLYYNNDKLTISDKFIISEVTSQDDNEMYAWFRMVADAMIMGNSDLGLVYLPAIMIEKFAKIYGSRSLQYSSNYLYYSGREDADMFKKSNTIKQSAEDLKFMIQAFAANTFLKKGSLVLQNVSGIKRGTNLYIQNSNMLYYVDSYKYLVSQNDFQVDVNVSRGMPFNEVQTFFNLIDIQIDDDKVTNVSLNEKNFEKLLKKKYG